MENTNYNAKIFHKKTLGQLNSEMRSNLNPKTVKNGLQSNLSPRTSESVLYPTFEKIKNNRNMVNKSLDMRQTMQIIESSKKIDADYLISFVKNKNTQSKSPNKSRSPR